MANGPNSGTLTIIVLPASSAGAILRLATMSGKFHGTMPTQTPSGCLTHDEPATLVVDHAGPQPTPGVIRR